MATADSGYAPTLGGMLPILPAWKSSIASMISDFVFITNTKHQACWFYSNTQHEQSCAPS